MRPGLHKTFDSGLASILSRTKMRPWIWVRRGSLGWQGVGLGTSSKLQIAKKKVTTNSTGDHFFKCQVSVSIIHCCFQTFNLKSEV